MSKPYGVMADLHLHNWQAFSSVTGVGLNTRLAGLLIEFKRCAVEVKAAGGDSIFIVGDVFHVRGSIAPSVFNPAIDTFRDVIRDGMKIFILPGNHDLEGKSSSRLSSAVTSLEEVGCKVASEPLGISPGILMVPWIEDVNELKKHLLGIDEKQREKYDLMLHAPMDGVIAGLSGALDPKWLASLGFKRVFAGHYHNFKEFESGKVYSVGALAHHTWSDVGSKAGFLIVSDGGVRWMKSHLPEFVDITGEVSPEDLPLLVEGNFVRAKIESSKMEDVESIRAELNSLGAVGVVIQSVKKPAAERDGKVAASVKTGASLEVSVSEFIKSKSFDRAERVNGECMKILAEAGA